MAKKPKNIPAMFDIKGDFIASLDRFVHEAGMLRDAVRQLLHMGKFPDSVRGILEERLKAFDLARSGEVDPE